MKYRHSLSAALLLVACSPTVVAPDGGSDAFVVEIDAARSDAGPPVCTGTPQPCGDRDPSACGSQCYHRTCFGEPRPCSRYYTLRECQELGDCLWSSDDVCEGFPSACGVITEEARCEANGCSWVTTQPCEGSPQRCEALDALACAAEPGCMRAGALDAGPTDSSIGDASTVDAPPPADAGSCPATGCHPLYDAACGCGYSATAFDWACGRAGSGAEGASCDNSAICGAGLYCSRRTSAARGQCRRLCDTDADCGAGEGCASVGDLSISCTGMCLPLAQCDLDLQDCPAGQGCYWLTDPEAGREHQFCNRAGTGTSRDSCFDDPTTCVRGLVCAPLFTTSLRCGAACVTDADCDGSDLCTGTTASGDRYCR